MVTREERRIPEGAEGPGVALGSHPVAREQSTCKCLEQLVLFLDADGALERDGQTIKRSSTFDQVSVAWSSILLVSSVGGLVLFFRFRQLEVI